MKGAVLGTVDNFYWKKEYQARGAPHYHILLWISQLLVRMIQMKYYLGFRKGLLVIFLMKKLMLTYTDWSLDIKCTNGSAYCKRKHKCGSTFITRCRFGFPHQVCESAVINCVDHSLKSRQKIYGLTCTELEIRVNDYNPLILMLWQANIDIQFVAES